MQHNATGYNSDRHVNIWPGSPANIRPMGEIDLYSSDEYISKNPTLHEEDSPWKVSKITPIVDLMFKESQLRKEKVNLLDVGGGAGILLREIARHITRVHRVAVVKRALDLSPGMLAIQSGNNNDLCEALNEDICQTSLPDKGIDLTLAIDVLEHVQKPEKAIRELCRISKFAILKVPLEDNLCVNLANLVTLGGVRKNLVNRIGHINTYSMRKLRSQLENNGGEVLFSGYANVFSYYMTSEHYLKKMGLLRRTINKIASKTYAFSPEVCASIFNDFAMVLVKFD